MNEPGSVEDTTLITDLEVLRVMKRNRAPMAMVSIAKALGIDATPDFGKQLSRMVTTDRVLDRWPVTTGGFQYGLTTKGREVVLAAGEDSPHREPQQEPALPAPKESPVMSKTDKQPSLRSRAVEAIQRTPGITAAGLATALEVDTKAAQNVLYQLKGSLTKVRDPDSKMWKYHFGASKAKASQPKTAKARKTRKARVAPARKRTRTLKVRKPYERKVSSVRVPAEAKVRTKDEVITIGVDVVAPLASFTRKGEILITAPGGAKLLDVEESRQVIELVRHFDKVGLLPKAA